MIRFVVLLKLVTTSNYSANANSRHSSVRHSTHPFFWFCWAFTCCLVTASTAVVHCCPRWLASNSQLTQRCLCISHTITAQELDFLTPTQVWYSTASFLDRIQDLLRLGLSRAACLRTQILLVSWPVRHRFRVTSQLAVYHQASCVPRT